MQISIQGYSREFTQVQMTLNRHGIVNVFAELQNKTLAEALLGGRYAKMSDDVRRRYPDFLDEKIGGFLFGLKTSNDTFYKHFLNKYGDSVFCDFSIERTALTRKKGIYCFVVADEMKYVGRSHDPFEKRFNQGYGHIWPKNCYLDGQSTNCRVNSLIAEHFGVVSLLVYPIEDDSIINPLEESLNESREPAWNIRR